MTRTRHLALSLVYISAVSAVSADNAAGGERLTVEPADTGVALVNPQMGWTLHFYSNIIANYGSKLAPSDTLDDFPGLSTIYLRLPWAFIEKEEGQFDWTIVDAPSQRWIDRGLRVAFRFSVSESWLRYATPKWVADAGAKGYDFRPGTLDEKGPFWEPQYDDPIFIEKLDAFLAAAAARYDGRQQVDFIDVGSFGVWGEGHTFSSTGLKYSEATIRRHLDLHAKHFTKTLLAANDDLAFFSDEAEKLDIQNYPGARLMRYAQQLGMTLRDDSILVQPPPRQYYNADMAQWFWRDRPVILECQHYGPSRDRGIWGDGSWYLRAVEEYHASYAAIHWWPREFLEEQRSLIDAINRRLGYRLNLTRINFPRTVRKAERFSIETVWANVGVAPCYPGGFMALTLKDAEGGIAAVFVDGAFDLRDLGVGPPGKAPARALTSTFGCAPNTPTGTFSLYVSVGDRMGTPIIALPLQDGDGKRRYKLGEITIEAP